MANIHGKLTTIVDVVPVACRTQDRNTARLGTLLLALFLALNVSGQVIQISVPLPPWFEGGSPYHMLAGEQLAFNTMEIRGQWGEEVSQFLAGYGCYDQDQFDIATLTNWRYEWSPHYAKAWTINRPCMFAAAGLPHAHENGLPGDCINFFPTLSPDMRAYRVTDSKGTVMKIDYEILPPGPSGERRFVGMPASE